MALSTAPELERASAQEVIAYAVERFGPRLTMACSFQKEESVLVHMTSQIAPDLRIFTIDTGVLFPETLATWKRFEDRFGVNVESIDATSPGQPWTPGQLLRRGQGRGARSRVGGPRGLDHRDPARTGADSAAAPKLEHDDSRGIWKVNPLADWSEKDLWRYIHRHELPYHPLHDQGYASIGCAPCTLPGSGREGRWAGEDKTECGLHVTQSGPLDPVT